VSTSRSALLPFGVRRVGRNKSAEGAQCNSHGPKDVDQISVRTESGSDGIKTDLRNPVDLLIRSLPLSVLTRRPIFGYVNLPNKVQDSRRDFLHPFRVRTQLHRCPVVGDHRLLSRSLTGCRISLKRSTPRVFQPKRESPTDPPLYKRLQMSIPCPE